MAAKRDNNRVLSMLERMGMIQKVEGAQPPNASAAPDPRIDAPESAPMQSPARRQDLPPEQAEASGYANVEMMRMSPDIVRDPYTTESPSYPDGASQTSEPMQDSVMQRVPDTSFWDNATPVSPDADRYTDVEELYRTFGMRTSGTDTVYLVEEYLKTLPESLPSESRRNIILKIVNASGFDFDKLLSDGIDRVARLNEYASSFAAHTEEIINRYNAEIDALQQQMQRVQELIGERKNLHKRQFLAIENEAQRLREVLDFITK